MVWYRAASFPDKETSGKVYQPLQEVLKKHNIDLTTMRIMFAEKWVVVCFSPVAQSSNIEKEIVRYLNKGTAVQLPANVLEALLARRQENIGKATPLSTTHPGKFYESHTPVNLGKFEYYGAVEPASQLTPDDIVHLARDESIQTVRDAAKRHKQDDSFTATIGEVSPGVPLEPGSKVHMKTIPFIKGYQDIAAMNAREVFYQVAGKTRNLYTPTAEQNAIESIETINKVNNAVLRAATKYLFTTSALRLHDAVFHFSPGLDQPLTIYDFSNHVWIELEQDITTPYADNVKAIYLNNAYPVAEINRVASPATQAYVNARLLKTFDNHKLQWTLAVINTRCDVIFDLTYNLVTQQWMFLGSHKCPYHICKYTVPDVNDQLDRILGATCTPCDRCREACRYFAQWLVTALKIIHRDYATSPTPTPFSIFTQEYDQVERDKVGKGKNTRVVQVSKRRKVDYILVRVDISTPAHTQQAATHKEAGKQIQENWLVKTAKGDIVWVKKRIAEYKRRYPTGYATTHTDVERVIVRSHPKYIPMLRPELKKTQRIHKIVASQYESETT